MTLLAWSNAWRPGAWRIGAWATAAKPRRVWGGHKPVPLAPRPAQPLTGELRGEVHLSATGAAVMRLAGRIEAEALLEGLAMARLRLGGGQLMAAATADAQATAALLLRAKKLRNHLEAGAKIEADALDVDALAILLLLGDL